MLMRTAISAGLALALLALLAAGCGDDDDEGGGKAALQGPLIYERGGGIAGRRGRLVVQPDGTAKLTVRDKTSEIELKPSELDRIAADVEQADLPSVPENSRAPRPVPDAFGYRIQYGASEITTDDTAMPEALRGLVARLGGLVDRYAM
jgi:hypothetical protein